MVEREIGGYLKRDACCVLVIRNFWQIFLSRRRHKLLSMTIDKLKAKLGVAFKETKLKGAYIIELEPISEL